MNDAREIQILGKNIFVQTGAGFSDIFAKVAAKVTGKTAKKGAEKNWSIYWRKNLYLERKRLNHLKRERKKLCLS